MNDKNYEIKETILSLPKENETGCLSQRVKYNQLVRKAG